MPGHDPAYEARRLERNPWRRFYATRQWKQLRAWHIGRHPLCAMCEADGHVTAARVVDHIRPHKGDWALFTDPANLQSLCDSHHASTKQREEATGHVVGSDTSGLPLDPGHHWVVQ